MADALSEAVGAHDAASHDPTVHDPTGGPAHAEEKLRAALVAIEQAAGDDAGPAVPFLAMAERAEKVAPIQGDKARLTPVELLQMIGGPLPGAGAPASPHEANPDAPERRALLERLARAAWDVILAGAAEHEPELRGWLVQICTRIADIGPRGPGFPGPVAL
jgi:hypothetical protein